MNATQLSARIEQLKSLLRIDKKQTTTERQTKISAKDDRVSSVSIGLIFGVGVLVSSSLAIVISDFTAIYRDIKNGPLACKKKLNIFNFRNKHSWYEAERIEFVWFANLRTTMTWSLYHSISLNRLRIEISENCFNESPLNSFVNFCSMPYLFIVLKLHCCVERFENTRKRVKQVRFKRYLDILSLMHMNYFGIQLHNDCRPT